MRLAKNPKSVVFLPELAGLGSLFIFTALPLENTVSLAKSGRTINPIRPNHQFFYSLFLFLPLEYSEEFLPFIFR
ncbi:MAG: hypothetical protein LBB43_07305, partial [Spirochaetaceae bacterium]|jgi:hypothetical protein|nr:hypothetical protein [Spirochaetaceae bacterium]